MKTMTKKIDVFESYRPLLFSIAYRMLGSVMEAEDLVQESYLRYSATDPATIKSAKAFLSTIITRLCLDHLKSAQVQRENYVGPWLPEPLLSSEAPEQILHQKESITMAFLVLLETLSPTERAVFLLRDVFEYPYAQIAQILDKKEANCRQLYRRAKGRLRQDRPRFETSPQRQQAIISTAMQALNEGDEAALMTVLAQDIALWSDGGGKVVAAGKPLFGRDIISRFLFGLARLQPEETQFDFAEVNGTESLIIRLEGQIISVMNFICREGKIAEIRSVLNPDKLKHLPKSLK